MLIETLLSLSVHVDMWGLALTFDLLAKTPNEAAVRALIHALEVNDRSVRAAALRAMIHRNSSVAKEAVVRRWHCISEPGREFLTNSGREWLSPALRIAIRDYEDQFNANGLSAAIALRDYEMIPTLVEAMNDRANPFNERAAITLIEISELLHDVLHSPRDYRDRRDPNQLRQYVLPSLEHCVTRGDGVCRMEISEAFLLLAGRDNAALKHVLVTSTDRHHQPFIDLFTTSSRPGLTRLLLSYLEDSSAPLAALQVIGRRTDITFIRQLFRRIGNEPSKIIRANLKRITKCVWLEKGLALLEAVNESEQAGAANFAVHSGIDRGLALEVVAFLFRRGGPAARRSAVGLLVDFASPFADELCLLASNDNDPYVRALSAPQLRNRGLAGGIQRLLEMVGSENEIEREAARTTLDDFRFDHLVDVFDGLTPEMQKQTGLLVKRIDPQALTKLSRELSSEHRQQKQRGLQLVVALDAIGELHHDVTALLHDPDEYLRAEAVRVLSLFDMPETRQALRSALLDSSRLVQETAERALTELKAKTKHPFGAFENSAQEGWSPLPLWNEPPAEVQRGNP